MYTEFTPLLSLLGGALIGLSATLFMMWNGRIAGMTGILSGVIPPLSSDWKIRLVFLLGAILAPLAFVTFGGTVAFEVPSSTAMLIGGGFIVGIGVMLGGGCTSGHGVCGIARFSTRSIVATATFMASTFVTVFVIRHILGA